MTRSPEESGFSELVEKLRLALNASSNLDSPDIYPQELQDLMLSYVSTEEEWSQYALADYSRGYTRNLIDKGNGKSNLVR